MAATWPSARSTSVLATTESYRRACRLFVLLVLPEESQGALMIGAISKRKVLLYREREGDIYIGIPHFHSAVSAKPFEE